MTTSIIIYIPHLTRKATMALIRDTEYQMRLRTLRKWPHLPVNATWRNCRREPALWELKATMCG
jgi:hypothetical protein